MSKAKRLLAMHATTAKSATVHYVLSESNATNREQRRKLDRDHRRQEAKDKIRARQEQPK